MSRFGHRPLGRIAEMFNQACLNNVFGDPDGDLNDKHNIPVHVRQTQLPTESTAYIEANSRVTDPRLLGSDQLALDMTEKGSIVGIQFHGLHFDATQFAIIAQELAGKPDIQVTDPQRFEIQITNPDDQKMTIVAQAWKKGITQSLKDLGYEL
mgnify:CR=1 FL=1